MREDDPEYVRLCEAEKKHWDGIHPDSLEALEPKFQDGPVHRHTNKRYTGDENTPWWETISSYGTFHRGAVLGAGSVEREARVLETNPDLRLKFFDISEGPLARRREVLGARFPGRVETQASDLNFLDLQPDHFDLIVSSGAIHHITNLERLAQQINQALTADGYFFLEDYVGESRFEFSEEKKRLYTELVGRDSERQGKPRHEIDWSDKTDLSPFCGVRSADILPVLAEALDEIQRRTTDTLVTCLLRSRPAQAAISGPSPFDSDEWIYQASKLDLISGLLRSKFPRIFGKMRSHQDLVNPDFMNELLTIGDLLGDVGLLTPNQAFCIYRKRADTGTGELAREQNESSESQ